MFIIVATQTIKIAPRQMNQLNPVIPTRNGLLTYLVFL